MLAIGASICLTLINKLELTRFHIWAVLLLLWAVASIFWSASVLDTIGELWHWLVLFILFVVALQCQNSILVLWAFCLGLCVNVPFVLFQLRGSSPVVATDIPGGLFLSRNTLGELAACALVWATVRCQWLLVPALLFLVLASGSRGAILSCIVGGSFWVWDRVNRRQLILGLITAVLVLLGLITLNPESSAIRLDIWQLTILNLTILGHGLETFGALAPQYEFVHNDFLQLVFELGIGSILLVPLLVQLVKHENPEAIALIALAGASLVSFPLHHPMGAALMAVLAGLSFGTSVRTERSERISRAVTSSCISHARATPSRDLQ